MALRSTVLSLRSRIYLLAVLTCILLVGAAAVFLVLLRNNESSILAAAENHAGKLAQTLAQDYASRSTWEMRHAGQSALGAPTVPGSDPLLSLMTSAVLQHEIGVEGGFYSKASGDLLGYAFPTHEGPGPKKDIPGRERPSITGLARNATVTGRMQALRFVGARDAVVFVAYPVTINRTTIGATWIMQRLPGLNSGNNLRLLGGMAAFAAGALFCAGIAFLVVAEVQRAVRSIADYLHGLGQNLATPRPGSLKLAEFEGVVQEVGALADTLREKNRNERELEAKLRHGERLSALGQFAAGIAHEIRNPLATVRLRTQMTQRASDDPALQRNSEIALEEISRVDTMIERLLYFARPVRLDRERVDLAEQCRIAVDEHRRCAREQTVRMDVQVESPAFALADRNQLRQVLDNVLSNAIEAAQENGVADAVVFCTVNVVSAWAEIAIADSGKGFTPEAEAHLFEPFFTTKQRGTGLGLSLAREIVQAHDGELLLRNSSSGGAIVTLRLPSTDRAFDAEAEGGNGHV